jgi:alpha-tubulin suppressor-like RCC1 family protein
MGPRTRFALSVWSSLALFVGCGASPSDSDGGPGGSSTSDGASSSSSSSSGSGSSASSSGSGSPGVGDASSDGAPTPDDSSFGSSDARSSSGSGAGSSGAVVAAISAGGGNTCALLPNGTVECWGYGGGEVGNGSMSDSVTPVAVTGLTGVTAISAGGGGTACALLSNGTVDCWGSTSDGQLGNGTTSSSYSTPVTVTGLTGVTAISVGADSTCALLSNGTVDCWGNTSDGQLGNGTTTGPDTCPDGPCSSIPVAVTGLTGVTAISAGDDSTCALLSNGTVDCWGSNGYGQLGNGTTTGPDTCSGGVDGNPCSTTPVEVSGLTRVTAISAGAGYACALLSNGTVDCWGNTSTGQLGNGTSTGPDTCSGNPCSTTPVKVSGLTGVTAVSAGASNTCALLSNGTADCWGDNFYGQLGIGTSTGPDSCSGYPCSTTPVVVTGLAGVTAISAGSDHICAVLSSGPVDCWGYNQDGELGNGSESGPDSCVQYSESYPCSTTPIAASGL